MQKQRLDGLFSIRLDPKTDKALFDFARRKGVKRADLIREILDNFEVAYSLLKQYEEQQKAELNGDMTELLLNRFPDAPPNIFRQLAEAVGEVAERREQEWASKQKVE